MRHVLALALLAMIAAQFNAHAGDYPERAIRIVVPFPAGSSADINTRQIAHLLSGQLQQSVVIDNRPGANGAIGAAAVAQAPPDGYTLLYATSHVITVNPHLAKNPGFDALNDFVPIIISGSGPAFLVVSIDAPFRSVSDLIAAAKNKPGKLTYGTSGDGSAQHIMGEKLRKMAGIDIVPVSFRGETPALQALMSKEIDFCFGFALGTMPFVRGGKLRVLATTNAKRLATFPDVPTVAEAALPGYSEVTLTVYLAPRGTPIPIVKKLNHAIRTALYAIKEEMAQRGAVLIASSPEQASATLKAEHARYGALVKELGLKPR